MNKVTALVQKEWYEATRNRMVLFTALFLPLVFVAIPIIMLAVTRNVPPGDASMDDAPPGMFNNPAYAGLTDPEILQAYMANQMMILFLVMPLAIPMTIATYSIVGEKREKSLEPLLATPITVPELLFGKAVAATLPGVAATWLAYVIFLIAARFFVISDAVYATILSPTWLLSTVLVAPLLTVLAVTAGIIVSSRVNDPRAAEQLGMVIILPVLGLLFAQVAGLVFLGPTLVLAFAGGLVLADVAMIYFAARLFQRETILTRWK
jgi:ABC-2 type transport system permease protein